MKTVKLTNDPESEFYIEKFAGRIGELFDVTRSSKGTASFHINFGNEIGIFHENEIEYVTE
ncbi:hypothetical protein ABES03_08400 [Neobacillus rhizosphaerae]|uniref:hypothetical protein n=1 Tax=Neobacillus rhizosphaerae TaxID=2880965 RepID=UPI003D28AE33